MANDIDDKLDFAFDSFHTETVGDSFHRELALETYRAPERFRTPDGEIDFTKIRMYVGEISFSAGPQTAASCADQFFIELGITPLNWEDFRAQSQEYGYGTAEWVEETADSIAAEILKRDSGLDDESDVFRAARFLFPLVSVSVAGKTYGINVGAIHHAWRDLDCSFERIATGRRLREVLQREVRHSVTGSEYGDGVGDGVCYEIEAASYDLLAQAGSDSAVNEQADVPLAGADSYSTTGGKLRYEWNQISGASVEWKTSRWLANPIFRTPIVLAEGEKLEFELTVTDEYGNRAMDRVSCVIRNSINEEPTAQILGPKEILSGREVILEAMATDENPDDAVSFSWDVVFEDETLEAVVLSQDARHSRVSFRAPATYDPGEIRVRLMYADDAMRGWALRRANSVEHAIAVIPKGRPPAKVVSAPSVAYAGYEIVVDAAARDPDLTGGKVDFHWVVKSGDEVLPASVLGEDGKKSRIMFQIPEDAKTVTVEVSYQDQGMRDAGKTTTETHVIRVTPEGNSVTPSSTPVSAATIKRELQVAAKETGGKVITSSFTTQGSTIVSEEGTPILRALDIASAKPKHFRVIVLIDASGSMDAVAEEIGAKAASVVKKMLGEVAEDGTIQLGLYYYGNGQTQRMMWSDPVAVNDSAATKKLISNLQTKSNQVASDIREKGYYIESLWHTMGKLLSGPNKLDWRHGPDVVQRIVVLTDYEMDNPENIIRESGVTWKKNSAIAACKKNQVEFWAIQMEHDEYVNNSNYDYIGSDC